ncbi:MAG TPA: ABC transporter substrate-binding protein [Stellaceae bacterium]|nr:ABC transporter substrate-binding protein [Stellaceae bacterium]
MNLRWLMAFLAAALSAARPAAAEDHALLALPADVMQFLGIYAAAEEGFWQREGLSVKTQFIAGVGSFNAVVAGSSEFSVSSAVALTRAAAHGQRMLAIANMIDKPVWSIVIDKDIAAKAGIGAGAPLAERARLMAGRRMGIDAVNSVVHGYLRVIARAGGLDPDGVTVAPLQPPETLAAFGRHALDGFVGGPPWPQLAEVQYGAVPIASPLTGDPPWIAPNGSGVIVTRPQFCAEHRAVCVEMGRGLAAGARFIHDEPQAALALLKKHFPNTPDPVLAAVLAAITAGTPVPPVMTRQVLENSERLNIEAGFLAPADRLASYDGLTSDEFAR